MSDIILGIGELGASNRPGDIIKTFALGSCVALMMIDPVRKAVGMVHIALPDSTINAGRRDPLPGYFADTAIPALIAEMGRLGCQKNGRGLIIKLAGGSEVMDTKGVFKIGERNISAIHEILAALGMGVSAKDLGGSISRTVALKVDNGEVTLTSPGRQNWYL